MVDCIVPGMTCSFLGHLWSPAV